MEMTRTASRFRDFPLQPELLRAIVDCGFELSSCTSCIGRGWPKRASLVSYPTMPWLGITCIVPDTSPPQADGVSCWPTGLAIVSTRVTGGVRAIACVAMQGVTTQQPCHALAPNHPLAGGCGCWLTGLVCVLIAFAWFPGLVDAPAESAVLRKPKPSIAPMCGCLLGLPSHLPASH